MVNNKFSLLAAIKQSLQNMNPQHTDISKISFDEITGQLKENIVKSRIQERPFAYEFYHQFRKLQETNNIDLPQELVFQAEVSKKYQHIPNLSTIPDFLVHCPNSNKSNFAVIEFKVASSNPGLILEDLAKLNKFKSFLGYDILIEVIIGEDEELKMIVERLFQEEHKHYTYEIDLILFSTDDWKVKNIL